MTESVSCYSFAFAALRGFVLAQTYESFCMESYWIKEWLFKQVASRENGLEEQSCYAALLDPEYDGR